MPTTSQGHTYQWWTGHDEIYATGAWLIFGFQDNANYHHAGFDDTRLHLIRVAPSRPDWL